MREFSDCSGPWTGQSIQEGFRLTERIDLRIEGGRFSGTGTDVDGEFELEGVYDSRTNLVSMVRRYSVAPKNPEQVGYPFDYSGRWDGSMVFGHWQARTDPLCNGPFEMWPESAEEAINFNLEELKASH